MAAVAPVEADLGDAEGDGNVQRERQCRHGGMESGGHAGLEQTPGQRQRCRHRDGGQQAAEEGKDRGSAPVVAQL